ncbi:MAG TPA: DegT/DnrJ/EryC1/StrS family aminotransferase [Gemmatimonadales bacterium]|jgi:dTDP-4-amino-4,6-dideoxygalactose transaminase|nr:DegT/DnrJ/EryC1/StrS family aminotransferase [Gemmatimonadales bacterium]
MPRSLTAAPKTTVPFLDLVAPHRALEAELVTAFRRALESASFVGGVEVAAFEREFAAFIGSPGAVAVNSGTDALRFAYQALGVRPGDEVITVPNTFIATTEALSQAGATIRFVEVREDTLTIDPEAAAAAVGPRTVGIVPVHLYGQMAEMAPLLDLAAQRGLWIVEDAAQAHGASDQGRHAGTQGALGAFSFYPGKNLGACGEGGAVVAPSEAHRATVRRLREHGQSSKYVHETEGYNGRMDAIQAAFLRIKLRHLSEWNAARRRAAELYRKALVDVPGVRLPVERPGAVHVYHLFVIRAERRDALQQHLAARGIGTGLHYPVPLHLQAAYSGLGLGAGSFPVTEAAARDILSLPMFPELTADQIGIVADAIREFYRS